MENGNTPEPTETNTPADNMPTPTPSGTSVPSPSMGSKGAKLAVAIIAAIVLIGGASAAVYFVQHRRAASVDLALETHLPANSVMVISVDADEPDAKRNLPGLAKKFGTGMAEQSLSNGIGTLLNGSAEQGAQAEFAAVIASSKRLVIAATDENPSILYSLAEIRDQKKYDALEKKLLSIPGYTKESYKSFSFLTKGEDGLVVTSKDGMVYMSSSKIGLQRLVDGDLSDTPLSSNTDYAMAMQKMGKSFLTVYFRPDFLGKAAEQAAMEKNATEEQKKQLAQAADSLKAITAMAFALKAEDEGLRISGTTFGNRQILDQMQFKFSSLPNHESYLVSEIPSGPTAIFSESYGLRSSFASSFRLNGMDSTQMNQLEAQLATMLQGIGLSAKDDVYPLFDKGSAFALQFDAGNIFPRLTVLTDVTGQEDRAGKVVTALGKALEAAIAKLTSPESGIPGGLIAKATVPVEGKNFTQIKFNTAALSAFVGADAPEALRTALEKLKVELWFGVTKEGRLMITTTSGLDARYGKDSISSEKDYKEASGKVKDQGRGMAYLHIANLSDYVGQVYQVMSSYQGGDGFASYAKAIESIKPLRYLILSSSASDYETYSDGFLKIGE